MFSSCVVKPFKAPMLLPYTFGQAFWPFHHDRIVCDHLSKLENVLIL